MSVERGAHLAEEGYVASRLLVVLRILVVDVEPIQAKIFEQPD